MAFDALNLSLNLTPLENEAVRDNFQKAQDFVNNQPFGPGRWQACEIYVTANTTTGKIEHKLGGIPLDAFITRLIAPSAARLKLRFADFTRTEIVFDVTGLAAGETLSARFLVGSFPDVVTVGTPVRASTETQEFRSKF